MVCCAAADAFLATLDVVAARASSLRKAEFLAGVVLHCAAAAAVFSPGLAQSPVPILINRMHSRS